MAGKRGYALDEIGFHESLADLPFAAEAAAQGAIGKEERYAALRGEVVEHELNLGGVCVAFGGVP